jgi:hypothetical protein
LDNGGRGNFGTDPMAPTKALIARDISTRSIWRRDAASTGSGVARDTPLEAETAVTETGKSAPLWRVLLAIAGSISATLVMAYGVTDFLVRWRQKNADDKYSEQQSLKEKQGKVREQKAWARIARKDPEIFVEKVILRKNPGSSERRTAIAVLFVANPQWVNGHKMLLSGIEFRNGTTLEGLGNGSPNGTVSQR